MNELMLRLENIVIKDIEDEPENESESEENIDWELMSSKKLKIDSMFIALSDMKLDADIHTKALQMYNVSIEKCGLKRIKFKNAIMCACVFLAFSIQGDPREETSLMKHFGVTKAKYTKGLKIVKTINIESRIHTNTLDNQIFKLCRDFNILDDLDEVKAFIAKYKFEYLNKNYKIHTSKKIVYCVLLYNWTVLTKSNIPTITVFASKCNISHISFKKILLKLKFILEENLKTRIHLITKPFMIRFNVESKPVDSEIVNKICSKLIIQ